MEGTILKRKISFLRANKGVVDDRKRRGLRKRVSVMEASSGSGCGDQSDKEMSDCESCTSNQIPSEFGGFSAHGLVRLEEDVDGEYGIVKNGFVSSLGLLGEQVSVVVVHKNVFSSLSGRARLLSFRVFSQATARRHGNNANIKFGWYGASRDGVNRVLVHGFGQGRRPENNGVYGSGIYLSPKESSLDSVMSSVVDEDGLQHVMLCRVLLGNLEEVLPGSEQFHPSSMEFDSGVDNLFSPKKYIVWNTHMNTHILPEYVISFKAPSCVEGVSIKQEPAMKPKSAWMPFPILISVLSRFLSPNIISLIQKCHGDYREKKITRQHLILRVRQIAGDKLLASVIKAYRGKQPSAATNIA
ncbi:hypothetical protein GIB67_004327 [Kingdonia uniflora]|uniref:Poly [ADP-ribose] polymerase n=1 Tax=Kingdonia uniflora TaxID=39325 RepID=A0A7J7MR38_9MAGN|nr:hypothetical protein GIB67_004327 [Kingdonia uniflora]